MECKPEPLDLVAFCSGIVDEMLLASAKSHTITLNYTTSCTQCMLDQKLLRAILTNLLTNAIKYSEAGTEVLVNLVCDQDEVMLSVQDHGRGIPEKDQKHLFNDFFRAKNVGTTSGTGLGLSIIKRAAEAHGGKVFIESKEGVGTRFIVILSTNSDKN